MLRRSKPPIWRRLEGPASITLADLHAVLQTAFGWSDSHLHEFDTAFGRFGDGASNPNFDDEDLRREDAVALEQVAPGGGDKLHDFGDDWQHGGADPVAWECSRPEGHQGLRVLTYASGRPSQ